MKSGQCKELEANVFDYGGHGVADKMRITMDKIQQVVGVKYGYPMRGVRILCFLLTVALILFSQVLKTSVCAGTLDIMALNLSSPCSLATEMGNLAKKTTTTSSCLAQESGEALVTGTMFIRGIMTGEVVYGIMTGEVVYGIMTGEVVYYNSSLRVSFSSRPRISTRWLQYGISICKSTHVNRWLVTRLDSSQE